MKTHLQIIGAMLVSLAAMHAVFPRYFRWKQELQSLNLINRQVMGVHTFFIALTVAMMGALSMLCVDELMHTSLGRKISGGIAVFWAARLIVQFFVYSPKLWQGKRFETAVHIIFALLWTYFAAVFTACAMGVQP